MVATLQHLAQEMAEQGYTVARGLFSLDECQKLADHFMELRQEGRPGDFSGVDLSSSDPLKKYPRMIHMHRWDEASFAWLTDPRLNHVLIALGGSSPYAVQTMLYFKPAGARGQALHQDNMYLKTEPGTCIAAWLALDDCDVENGCMQVVPGTHNMPMLCTIKADTTQSFTDVTVPVPEGMAPVPVCLKAGDVLFFNGSLIHGSFPNESPDRFRRALIGHYVTGDAIKVAEFYHPAYRMDGSLVKLEVAVGGSECGVFVEGELVMMSKEAHDLVTRHE